MCPRTVVACLVVYMIYMYNVKYTEFVSTRQTHNQETSAYTVLAFSYSIVKDDVNRDAIRSGLV